MSYVSEIFLFLFLTQTTMGSTHEKRKALLIFRLGYNNALCGVVAVVVVNELDDFTDFQDWDDYLSVSATSNARTALSNCPTVSLGSLLFLIVLLEECFYRACE